MGRKSTDMKRINFYVTKKQEEILKKDADEIGISLSEYFRRILDIHIGQKDK